MRNFELLSHTADVRIHAEGSTIEDLFLASLLGLCSVLSPEADFNRETNVAADPVTVNSSDCTSLLIDFLAEALYLMYRDHTLLFTCSLELHGTNSITATFGGVKADGFDNDVKAVTYHEAEVLVNDNGDYECTIVLDI